MRIGEFECPDSALPVRPGVTITASRDGGPWILGRCGRGMLKTRARAVTDFLNGAVLDGSNVIRPELFWFRSVWYAAAACRPDMRPWFPARCFADLPREKRTRYMLTALAAVLTLTRAGAVHGSLSPDSFRIGASEDGRVHALLVEGVADIGFNGERPLDAGAKPWLCAPELRAGKAAPSAASDVWSLGMCCHLWLCGEYPRLSGKGAEETMLLSQAIPQRQRSVLWAMLQPDPSRRIALRDALIALRDEETAGVKCPPGYFDVGPAKEERDLITRALDL